MQEKIWGGTHLRDAVPLHDIPSDHVGGVLGYSHPNGVSTIKNGRYAGQTSLDAFLYAEHRELLGNRKEPVFPLLIKIFGCHDCSVQVHPVRWCLVDLNMKANLVKQSVLVYHCRRTRCWIIYGHNAKSKEELRQQIESKDWGTLTPRFQLKQVISSLCQVGTMHATAGILVLKPNSRGHNLPCSWLLWP